MASPLFIFMRWDKALKKEKYIFVPIYLICYLITNLTGIYCIWKWAFKIPCPGCGFTRAVFSMFRLDFKSAWNYHPMFWSVFILALYFIFEGDVFKNRIVNRMVIGLVLFGFLLTWICRLI